MEHQSTSGSPQQEPLRLEAFLPFRLSVLSNMVSEKIALEYRRAFDLTVPQWRVMAVVHGEPGISAKDVSSRTVMDKVAVSRAVARLIEQGRMTRAGSKRDGRLSALFLTKAGEDVYAAVAPRARSFEQDLVAHLTEEERRILEQLLGKLALAVSPDRRLW